MTRVLLLSVRPRFARALLDGTKTVEVRRRFPDVPSGTTVLLYSSSPERALLGTMRVRALVRIEAEDIWRTYKDEISIQWDELSAYLSGASMSSVLELESPVTWRHAVPLDSMRRVLGLEPPQSFRYLTARQLSKVEAAGSRPSDVVSVGADLRQPVVAVA